MVYAYSNYLLQQSLISNIIFKGFKIIYCHFSAGLNIKLIDVLNFINMPLSQLPKGFFYGIEKGILSILYNTEENNALDELKYLQLPILPVDSFDYVTIVFLLMYGAFPAKVIHKECTILFRSDAHNKCMHQTWDCKY